MSQLEKIYQTLKQDERLVAKNGELLKNKLFELTNNLDSQLLKLLHSDESIKNKFFKDVDGVLIFDKTEFNQLIDSDGFLPNSYTKFKDGILLSDGYGNAIKTTDTVVLEFAGKDCVLEMDSTSDDDERDELFFNEVLASSEIDQLLSPKTFTNIQKHTIDGTEKVAEMTEKDNLIIKGNNLLALHSLLPRYSGKIKCMYWDILYNTQSDEVPYNDTFKHSSWLTMMKNRLEVARELLREDGSIYVHLDGTEMAYLKILCDEIFGRDNFVTMITCKVKAPSGVAAGSNMFFDLSEYILCYSKNKKKTAYNIVKTETEVVTKKSKTAKNYKYIIKSIDMDKKEKIAEIENISIFRIPKEFVQIETIDWDQVSGDYCFDNIDQIIRLASLSGGTEKKVKALIDEFEEDGSLFTYSFVPTKGKNKGILTENAVYKKQAILYLKDFAKINKKNKEVIKLDYISNIFSTDMWQGISSEGKVTLKNGKKPEHLIKILLEVSTNPGDIVLDAYLGSGTTAAVAQKMGRRYIGIEQLDDHFQMSKKRLSIVINSDKSGISKSVNWKGGGSFISCELASNSSTVIENIINANEEQLIKIYQELQNSPFISYRVDLLKMKEKQEEFENLSLLEQRQLLINLVEKNNLYINYSEIEDEVHNFDAKTKAFNHNFYQK